MERRGSVKGNSSTQPVVSTQRLTESEGGLARVRAAAREDKKEWFTRLFHHLDYALLERAYEALKRKAAAGVDGVDWHACGEDLCNRLVGLNERLQSGRYRAEPVRRVWIEKSDGGKRPLGVACLEDKVVRQAIVWILESIYEVDFLGFSYGFRPRKSAHKALDALFMALTVRKTSFVLDADVQTFFDTVEHEQLMRFLEHRIGDRRVLKLIQQTLEAGIVDDGVWQETRQSIAQGTVISPLLANIYLHYCLDLWANQWRCRYAKGEVYIIRYADDCVCCFQYKSDATSFKRALTARLGKFGLNLHPEKTRLIEFGRFTQLNRRERGMGKPETFDYLGFTHICSTRRSDGRFTVRRVQSAYG